MHGKRKISTNSQQSNSERSRMNYVFVWPPEFLISASPFTIEILMGPLEVRATRSPPACATRTSPPELLDSTWPEIVPRSIEQLEVRVKVEPSMSPNRMSPPDVFSSTSNFLGMLIS